MIRRKRYGAKTWAFAAGNIPFHSNGKEPEFTSHDKIAVLNISDREVELSLTILYEGQGSTREYRLTVAPMRVKKIRFNDLIDPMPVPLGKPFGFILIASIDVIVQFSRMITSSRNATGFCVTPFFHT